MEGGRVIKREEVPGDCAAIVVDDDGEPRLGEYTIRPDEVNIQRRVVGLPDRIGSISFLAMNQFEGIAVGFGPLVGQSDKIYRQFADDSIYRPIEGGLLSKILRVWCRVVLKEWIWAGRAGFTALKQWTERLRQGKTYT